MEKGREGGQMFTVLFTCSLTVVVLHLLIYLFVCLFFTLADVDNEMEEGCALRVEEVG